ncbi:hypothetical protein PIB30_019015 [Stylosanthes scabra]|uniref:AT3G52170-like helix-turn-helix domain-containing protein n=1 Tax=Stylosanthes scabra TaxID=79078 RepID=A0ABU6R8E5_9FABA|nr:hypothetical protein [Stylosanthes scabra]
MRKKLLIAATARLTFRSIHKPPSFDVSNSAGPVYVQRCGWSYAAYVSSDMPDAPKGRKRIPKSERRVMIESYVNEYRTMNAGKFPATKDVQRQVGGGYYVVREIMQELKYKSRMNSSKEMDENPSEQEQLNESKLQITVAAKVSSDNTGNAKERTAQDDSQSIGYGKVYDKAEGHVSEFVDTENHQVVEERFIGKEGYEKREKAFLGDIYGETSRSTLQVPKDVRYRNDMPSFSSASTTPERHQLKEQIEDVSASSVEKSSSSNSKAQSHDSEFVNMENHPILEEKDIRKAGYETKEQSAVEDAPDIPNHKLKQSQGSSKSDESKMASNNSVNQENSGALASKKPTLWGNLKSLADDIINIWKKF